MIYLVFIWTLSNSSPLTFLTHLRSPDGPGLGLKTNTEKTSRKKKKNLAKSNIHYFEGMKNLIERFYNSINTGSEMPISMDEALRATRIIDDIFTEVNS